MAYFQLKFPKIMIFALVTVFVKLIYEKKVYTTLVHGIAPLYHSGVDAFPSL